MPTERYAKGKGWMSGKRDVKRMKCLGLLGLLCWNQRSAGEPRHAVCLAARPAPSGRVFPAVLQERALLETSPARCCACSTCSQTMQMQKACDDQMFQFSSICIVYLVRQALARWWERHRIVSGAGLEDGIYMWWCVFVNNQFRMLEAGQVEEPDDLFDVFGQQLQGIGKMLMCLDKMRGGQYTTRIWCIFEVFVACQRPGQTIPALLYWSLGLVGIPAFRWENQVKGLHGVVEYFLRVTSTAAAAAATTSSSARNSSSMQQQQHVSIWPDRSNCRNHSNHSNKSRNRNNCKATARPTKNKKNNGKNKNNNNNKNNQHIKEHVT